MTEDALRALCEIVSGKVDSSLTEKRTSGIQVSPIIDDTGSSEALVEVE